MHALVTGGGGFLGPVHRRSARGPRRSRARLCAAASIRSLQPLGVEMVRGDIRDRDAVAAACRGIDCVFHAAALRGHWHGPWREYDAVESSSAREHVLEACRATRRRAARVTRAARALSFDGQRSMRHRRIGAVRLRLDGGQSRLLFAHQGAGRTGGAGGQRRRGLRTCALRPHLIWGPRDTHLIPRLIARARSGRLRRVGDGTNLVDMTYVENAAEAHLQAADALAARPLQRLAGGKAYFISQGEPVNCWQWIDEILALADLPPVRKSMSLTTAWRVGRGVRGGVAIARPARASRR